MTTTLTKSDIFRIFMCYDKFNNMQSIIDCFIEQGSRNNEDYYYLEKIYLQYIFQFFELVVTDDRERIKALLQAQVYLKGVINVLLDQELYFEANEMIAVFNEISDTPTPDIAQRMLTLVYNNWERISYSECTHKAVVKLLNSCGYQSNQELLKSGKF